jgi:hypothetical protein
MERRSSPRFIESTAGQIAAELSRLGVAPDERVTILLATDDLVQGRRESRLRVIVAGLTDADIDRMIEEERDAVQPRR